MKFKDALWKAYKGMGRSISRYPLTVVLIAVAVLNSFMIENPREDYARYLFTFLVGAMLSIVGSNDLRKVLYANERPLSADGRSGITCNRLLLRGRTADTV